MVVEQTRRDANLSPWTRLGRSNMNHDVATVSASFAPAQVPAEAIQVEVVSSGARNLLSLKRYVSTLIASLLITPAAAADTRLLFACPSICTLSSLSYTQMGNECA